MRFAPVCITRTRGRAGATSLIALMSVALLLAGTAYASSPLSSGPLIQEGSKLAGSVDEGRFGVAVALSGDGSLALVGGPGDLQRRGGAWILTRSGSDWLTLDPELVAGPAQSAPGATASAGEESCVEEAGEEPDECAFGRSVALSADGATALIGDPSGTGVPGTAWVFTRVGSGWTRGEQLTGGAGGGEGGFGKSVALSADGDTALVGDPSAAGQRGAAWLFTRLGATWAPVGQILAPPAGSRLGHFGRSVALSGDGGTALVGGPGSAGYAGAALVFTRSGSTWTGQPDSLTATDPGARAHFGKSVALSADGHTALIGGPNDEGGVGAAWAFDRSGSNFVEQGAKLTGDPQDGEAHFGYSVSLSTDGDVALVGAPHGEGGSGSATVLIRRGASWTRLPEELAGAEAAGAAAAGTSVALSDDARLALIGAPRDDARTGAAWAFGDTPLAAAPPPSVTDLTPAHGPSQGGTAVTISGTSFTAATAVSFGSVPAASFRVKSATTILAISPAEPAGIVPVTVTTVAATSAVTAPEAQFRFLSTGLAQAHPPISPELGGGVGASGILGVGPLGGGCTISLRKRSVKVQHNHAVVALLRIGAGSCRGRLTLSYAVKTPDGRLRSKRLAAGRFTSAPGRSPLVRLKLARWVVAMLAKHRGGLLARVSIVRLSPTPLQSRASNVRLQLQRLRRHDAHG